MDGMPFRGPDPKVKPRGPKRTGRVKDPSVARRAHVQRVPCVVCGDTASPSQHHVLPRGQGGDDDPANLVSLCGSGTTGCHGLIEANDIMVRRELGAYIKAHRPDTVAYVQGKLGQRQGTDWLRRRLYAPRSKVAR